MRASVNNKHLFVSIFLFGLGHQRMQSRSLVFPFVSFYHSPRFVCFFCFPGRKSNFAFVAVQIYYSISCSTIYVCRRKLYNCLCEVRARVCLTSVFVYVCLLHCAYNLYRIQTASNSEMDDALDMKSLDIMFQPSLWSKRYSTPEEVLNEHIAFAKAGKSIFKLLHSCLHSFSASFTVPRFISGYSHFCGPCSSLSFSLYARFCRQLEPQANSYTLRPNCTPLQHFFAHFLVACCIFDLILDQRQRQTHTHTELMEK